MRAWGAGLVWILAAGGLGGCGSDECAEVRVTSDVQCETTQDCGDEGLVNLSCVNGTCQRTCLVDADCTAGDAVEEGCPVDERFDSAYCEDRLCRVGCPDRACGAGQSVCAAGRCAYYAEGFEGDGSAPPSLAGLGWNGLGELDNPTQEIGLDCEGTACGAAEPRGAAAEGDRFAILGTEPTPEKGTALTAPTCRACACCVDCRLDPPSFALSVLDCPRNSTVPSRLLCAEPVVCGEPPPSEAVPAECTAVCDACEDCVEASAVPNDPLLSSCEADAAARSCASCLACDEDGCRSCREASCAEACADELSQACEACEQASACPCADCRDCNACSDAEACVASGGAGCERFRQRCDGLGADGCFQTPVRYPRAELTDAEQALTSPPVDLTAASAMVDVVVEFDFVPFSVGDVYQRSIQGVSACEWPTEPQAVVVQLCGGGCDASDAWVDAEMLPRDPSRNNGLRLGGQSGVDWRSGRVQVPVPAELRTSEFRFRLLPRLSEFARVGIDRVRVRTVP
jgi:hypothetical protein